MSRRQPLLPELPSGYLRPRPSWIPDAQGSTYVCIEGPQFSTMADRMSTAPWVFGSSNDERPGFKLAREAEICYASVALVTDYDVWKKSRLPSRWSSQP